MSHYDYTDGQQPVSSTTKAASGRIRHNSQPYAVPRRLDQGEILNVISEFCIAATSALEAGCDGVQLHMAHGYLVDQFLDAHVNDREDQYGGSVANRCRFATELTEAVLRVVGPKRLIVRISPSRWMNGRYEWPDMEKMVSYLLPALAESGLRMLDISCASADYHTYSGPVVRQARRLWPHMIMSGASLPAIEAQRELDEGWVDMVTYGRFLIANPDLVKLFRECRRPRAFRAEMLHHLV